MGLDMYIYKIKKAKLEDRVYTKKELRELGLSCVSAMSVDRDKDLYIDLLPYTIKRDVIVERYNVEKIIEDYNLPKNSYIGMYSYDRIQLCGSDYNGNRTEQYITKEEVEQKYIKTEVEMHYIWHEEEVAYWRKHYDLQDWIYDALGNVDNTKYCYLPEEIIKEINSAFNECVPIESDLFYWEWY